MRNLFKRKKNIGEVDFIGKKVFIGNIYSGRVIDYSTQCRQDGFKVFNFRCVDNYKKWQKKFKF